MISKSSLNKFGSSAFILGNKSNLSIIKLENLSCQKI